MAAAGWARAKANRVRRATRRIMRHGPGRSKHGKAIMDSFVEVTHKKEDPF